MSLVADYSNSSDSDEDNSTSSSSKSEKEERKNRPSPAEKPLKLLSASAALDNAAAKRTGDVFSNPFLEAELHKTAALERHVKMVNSDAHLQLKNGRKICWNYRKGRCRFGTSCQYAHDSDLSMDASSPGETKVETSAPTITPPTNSNRNNADSKRKRPGLSNNLEPGKRVMKAYQQQKFASGAGVRRQLN